ERVGKNGKTFRMHRFRTMVPDAARQLDSLLELNEKTGPVCKISADPRILANGVWLRKLSLDELPQSRNVLKGDIPQCIIKTGQGELCEISGLFALPAKEMRTGKVLFPQVNVASGTCLRTVQNFLGNLTVASAKSQETFVKRIFGPSLGSLNTALAVRM
ncbi:MAG: sugar transferase, partial [Raoultibacter sp.]